VIDADLAAFIEGPVMMVFAAADAAGRPMIGRATGARRTDSGEVELFVSRGRWGEVTDDLKAGAEVAVTFSRPADYRTFQIKCVLTAVTPAQPADLAAASTYMHAVTGSLLELGVLQSQVDQWLACDDLITLRFKPGATFAQTPGPGAGAPLSRPRR
jgi:hypothetical protein